MEKSARNFKLLVENVSKIFDGQKDAVLDSVSLTIPGNSVTAILGPSGCGKTTLLRIIAGLDKPSSGSIKLGDISPEQVRNEGRLGYAFQLPTLLPWRDVTKNIELPLEVLRKRIAEKDILSLIRLVDLTGEEKKKPRHLSGGMAQRVALARALVTRPDFLLLDEPFSALDFLLRRQLNVVFARLWEEKKPTTVIVTHETREAVFLADQVIVMGKSRGEIIHREQISFERPRSENLLYDDEFHSVCDRIEEILINRLQAKP